MPEMNVIGLVNKPPIDEIVNLDLVNKPDIMNEDALAHFGILGMKWGVRRYQNPDGTLTEEGKRRLAKREKKAFEKSAKRAAKMEAKEERKKKALEKKAQIEKESRERKILNPNPKYIDRNLHKFTNEEIRKAYERMEWKKKIEDIQKERIKTGKEKADTIIGYGETLNKSLKFINSDAGKGIRQMMGIGSKSIFNFSEKEAKAEELKRQQKSLQEEIARDERKLDNEVRKEEIFKEKGLGKYSPKYHDDDDDDEKKKKKGGNN